MYVKVSNLYQKNHIELSFKQLKNLKPIKYILIYQVPFIDKSSLNISIFEPFFELLTQVFSHERCFSLVSSLLVILKKYASSEIAFSGCTHMCYYSIWKLKKYMGYFYSSPSTVKSVQWITKPPTLLAGWEGSLSTCSI